MAIALGGPWPKAQKDDFLHSSTLPIRLSLVAEDGYPRVISLWYKYEHEKLYCVTHRSSKLAGLLKGNSRVGFEISPDAPPYHGIRGQGNATIAPLGSNSSLEDLLMRYIGSLDSDFSMWLLSRHAEELLIEITPLRFFSWDYRERMSEVE
jgi:hypothetical protein